MKKHKERWHSDTDNRYRGYRIDIDPDPYPHDPREDFEPMGKMICFHSRYNLGDEHNYGAETLMEELAEEACPNLRSFIEYWQNTGYARLVEKNEKADTTTPVLDAGRTVVEKIRKVVRQIIDRKFIILELYLYDHSGITMSSAPFSDPWDSGQIGIMVMTKEQAQNEYKDDPDYIAKATNCMEMEVKAYDAYLTGDVFGWALTDPEGCHIESCYGYYGYDENIDYIMSEVKAIVDGIYKDQEDEAAAIAYEAQQQPARQALHAAARWR